MQDRSPQLLSVTPRGATFEIRNGEPFESRAPQRVLLEDLHIARYRVSFAKTAEPGCPDMAPSIGPVARPGLYPCNVRGVALDGFAVEGGEGPAAVRENVA